MSSSYDYWRKVDYASKTASQKKAHCSKSQCSEASSASASSKKHSAEISDVSFAEKWSQSIRTDHRVPIEPTHCENLYFCPSYNRLNNFSKYPSTDNAISVRASTSSVVSHDTASFYCNVTVNLKNTNFCDSDCIELIQQLNQRVFKGTLTALGTAVVCRRSFCSEFYQQEAPARNCDTVFFISMDISENNLTCKGVKEIADWFIRNSRHVRLRHLKAYKNAISDGGVEAIAELIMKQPSALDELHLSHNLITSEGAAVIFKSFSHAKRPFDKFSQAKRKQKYIYPRLTDVSRGTFLPVWIRLEYNYIYEAPLVLFKWEAECRSLRSYDPSVKLICFADRPNTRRGGKDPHCSPARCLRATSNHSPLLHLYSYYHQSASQPLPLPKNVSSENFDRAKLSKTPTKKKAYYSEVESEVNSKPKPKSVLTRIKKPEDKSDSDHVSATEDGAPFTIQHKTMRTINKKFVYSPAVQARSIQRNATKAYIKPGDLTDKPPVKAAEQRPENDKGKTKLCAKQPEHKPTRPTVKAQTAHLRPRRDSKTPDEIVDSEKFPIEDKSSEDPKTSFTQQPRWDNELPSLSGLLSQMCPKMTEEYADTESTKAVFKKPATFIKPTHPPRLDLIDSAVVGIGKPQKTTSEYSNVLHHINSYNLYNNDSLVEVSNADFQNLQSVLKQGGINDCLDYSTLIENSSILTKPSTKQPKAVNYDAKNPVSNSQQSYNSIINSSLNNVILSTDHISSLPLYIFVDASAFAEMRRLTKFDHVNLFSFPGLLSLCEKRVICHSSMQPVIRKTVSGTQEKLDANQSLILMIFNSVEDGLLQMTESQPFLRETLVELYQDFISHLAKLGVIESIDGLESQVKNEWMILNDSMCKKADFLGAPLDAVKIIDFAFVWAHHLAKVSESNKNPTNNGRFPFVLFVTSNDKTREFFQYLQSTNLNGDILNNLICISLDSFNSILREAYPNLVKMVQTVGCLESTDQPYMDAQEILSAQQIRQLIQNYLINQPPSQASNWSFSYQPQYLENQNYNLENECQRSLYNLHNLLSKLIILYESQLSLKVIPNDFIQECKNECIQAEHLLNLKHHYYRSVSSGMKPNSSRSAYRNDPKLQFDKQNQFSCYM